MRTQMIPASRPKLTHSQVIDLLKPFNLSEYTVQLLGVRGYYKQTMGNPLANDYGVFDDAIFITSPDCFASFNFNTDPSVKRKGVAVLVPGTYLYKIGLHNMKAPYEALRQYSRVTVIREGSATPQTDTAKAPFYIDIHKGGINTTSSEGCQTVARAQWPAFLAMVKDQLKRYNQKIIPYTLIEF